VFVYVCSIEEKPSVGGVACAHASEKEESLPRRRIESNRIESSRIDRRVMKKAGSIAFAIPIAIRDPNRVSFSSITNNTVYSYKTTKKGTANLPEDSFRFFFFFVISYIDRCQKKSMRRFYRLNDTNASKRRVMYEV